MPKETKQVAKQKAKLFKIEVYVKHETNHKTKKEFTFFACKMKDGKWRDLKFTTDVPKESLPVSHSFIFVRSDKMNIDKSKKYPVTWVQAIERLEVIERPLEDLTQYFDEEPEDLPF